LHRGSGNCLLAVVVVDGYQSMRELLADVSRSFYLTLRGLPRPMRSPISLAYLLARASDTLADCDGPVSDRRIGWLDGFVRYVEDGEAGEWHDDARMALATHPHAGERQLVDRLPECIGWLREIPESQAAAIRTVIVTIVSGQRLDVQRFCRAGREGAVALASEDQLDDYTFRVAGCVGRFWSQIGYDVLGDRFSSRAPEEMESLGVESGKGLQLVNILRDLPRDLAAGRCYLPVPDPADRGALMKAHAEWLERSAQLVKSGFGFCEALKSRRLRAATVLPSLLAEETLKLLRGISWEELVARPKVPRRRVYHSCGGPGCGGVRRLVPDANRLGFYQKSGYRLRYPSSREMLPTRLRYAPTGGSRESIFACVRTRHFVRSMRATAGIDHRTFARIFLSQTSGGPIKSLLCALSPVCAVASCSTAFDEGRSEQGGEAEGQILHKIIVCCRDSRFVSSFRVGQTGATTRRVHDGQAWHLQPPRPQHQSRGVRESPDGGPTPLQHGDDRRKRDRRHQVERCIPGWRRLPYRNIIQSWHAGLVSR
jgi:farnesyl-diphosphate farnesyltransferase